MTTPQEVLAFWLDEVGPDGWYKQSDAVDAACTTRFLSAWEALMEGNHALWLTYPNGALAYVILADQLPRNMFRNEARAFASDPVARAAAKQALHRGWDLRIDAPARQFFYLPLVHSENLCDQDRAVRLLKDRLAEQPDNLLHARVHREVIRRFGRFPYRNTALGRTDTAAERAFADEGGYGAILQGMQDKRAA